MSFITNLFSSNKPTKQEKVVNASKDLYKQYGLEDGKDYKIYDIQHKTLPGYLSIFEAGFENEDVLIIIHGYAGSSAFNFKMFPDLIKRFHIYSLDLQNFGASYRYDTKFKDDFEALDFYLTSIHETIQSINPKRYYFASHSLGGYLTFHYLHKYAPTNVDGLIMISPAGCNEVLVGQMDDMFKQRDFNILQRSFFRFGGHLIHEKKMSPISLAFFLPWSMLIKRFFGHKRMKLEKKEKELFCKYYEAVIDYGDQGMSVVGHFQYYGVYSKIPTCVLFDEIAQKYNLVFLFGDRDWMPVETIRAEVEKIPRESKSQGIEIVEDCGHQMILENHKNTSDAIIKYYEIFKSKYEQHKGISLYADDQIPDEPVASSLFSSN